MYISVRGGSPFVVNVPLRRGRLIDSGVVCTCVRAQRDVRILDFLFSFAGNPTTPEKVYFKNIWEEEKREPKIHTY